MLTTRDSGLYLNSISKQPPPPLSSQPTMQSKCSNYENIGPNAFHHHRAYYYSRPYSPVGDSCIESSSSITNSSSSWSPEISPQLSATKRAFLQPLPPTQPAPVSTFSNADATSAVRMMTDKVTNGTFRDSPQSDMLTGEQHWQLVSNHAEHCYSIEAKENFVCFIGIDATSCELMLSSNCTDNGVEEADRRQAVLVYANGSFHIKDLNSSYGTYINERRVPSRCFVKLSKNDQIRFGFSTEVYQLQPVVIGGGVGQSVESSPPPKQSMNKLFRLKSGHRRKMAKEGKGENSSSGASSKLSPSSSSLMSSASSASSSSSSTAASPSSVFISAMKMMKMRFKKKSSKDKSLVCSGNEDITFIRYDSHSDVADGQHPVVKQSVSAPESPNRRPHMQIFHSHTFLDACCESSVDHPSPSALTSGDGNRDSRQARYSFGITEEEHDYDEVTREDDTDSAGGVEQMADISGLVHHDTSHDLIDLDTGAGSMDCLDNGHDQDTFNDILDETDVFESGDAFNEFDNCPFPDTFDNVVLSGENSQSFEEEPEKKTTTSSNCSSVVLLPHLNSEDRLNNNSSLDALFTESMLMKKSLQWEMANSQVADNATEKGCSLLDDQQVDDGGSEQQLREDLLHHGQHRALVTPTKEELGTEFGVDKPQTAASATVERMRGGPTTANNYRHLLSSSLSSECQKKECYLKISSTEPQPSLVAATSQQQSSSPILNANGSVEDLSVDVNSECEYDINDIGHLRRQLNIKSTTTGGGATVVESQMAEKCELDSTAREAEESRHSLGGMSFVINFDADNAKVMNENIFTGNRRGTVERKASTSSEMRQKRNVINNKSGSNLDCDVRSSPQPPNIEARIRSELKPTKSIDNGDSGSKASTSSRRSRSTQLSESAVYLINRMFEDSDYHHRQCCANGPNNEPDDEVYHSYRDTHYYPSPTTTTSTGNHHHLPHHPGRQSISSSRSASPYSLPQQDSSNYVCNSSSAASTRMEYDESLSSLHSNSDSTQRSSTTTGGGGGANLIRSQTTVIQSKSSQSTRVEEKQVDSVIDDDGDLIDDDLSDTGTYTVEIDNNGQRHKTVANGEERRNSKHEMEKYEEGSDYEVEDNIDDDEEEDKLEIARRKIDELFSVYTKQTTHNEMVENARPTVNNATFTRSKRRGGSKQQQQQPSDDDGEATPASATSEEYLSSIETEAKPKKRISSELLSALKKINSKLEKTAKLGNNSLDKGKQPSASLIGRGGSTSSSKLPSITTTQSAARQPSSKAQSAPPTPLLSENRKIYSRINSKHTATGGGTSSALFSRKSSITSIGSEHHYKSDIEDHRQAAPSSPVVDRNARARSESFNSNQSGSNLRFNRAFALRRARLGMDTCGVEITEQAATKAKESQAKSQPKKPISQSFRRNDGGRFSLRAPSGTVNRGGVGGASTKQPTVVAPVRKPTSKTANISKPPSVQRVHSSYSTASSACSSNENLAKISAARQPTRKRSSANVKPSAVPVAKISHSDNEILHDGGESSCDETPLLFNRFGRSSLRASSSTTTTSSTPWLQSLKANSPNINFANKRTTTQGLPIFNPPVPIQKSSSFSSKNYSSRGSHVYVSESYDTDTTTTTSECVRSIPSFQMGKRFFSTKPHQMAQFDRDFSSVARCSSASASNHKTSPDPNLMTHSATESLLSRHNPVTPAGCPTPDTGHTRLEQSPANPISSNINARILSISPLDSLVISAINQLSSKLRTRMRGFLEQERLNHSIGSETRSLIDEILPQVGTASGFDNQSGQAKNAYNHDPSNISRDLTNILKNLKKVEQIFDVFSMLVEPNGSQEVANETSVIITQASDSDTSGDSRHSYGSNRNPPVKSSRFQQPPPPPPPASSQSPPASVTSRTGFFIEI